MTTPSTGSVRENADAFCRFRPIEGGGFRAAVEVTRRCDLRCPHCFVPREPGEPSLERLGSLFTELAAAGCRKVLVTGGEPLLREDLCEIVAAALDAGMGVDLNSNLQSLAPGHAERLAEVGLREASVSFYGGREFHNDFVGRAGAYDAARHACEMLQARGVAIDIHAPAWPAHLERLDDVFALARELSAASLGLFSLVDSGASDAEQPRPNGQPRLNDQSPMGEEQFLSEQPPLDELAAAVRRLRARGGVPVRTVGFWGDCREECQMGRSIIGIDNRLELSPCLLARRGSGPRETYAPGTLAAAVVRLRRGVRGGDWRPACGAFPPASASAGPAAPGGGERGRSV